MGRLLDLVACSTRAPYRLIPVRGVFASGPRHARICAETGLELRLMVRVSLRLSGRCQAQYGVYPIKVLHASAATAGTWPLPMALRRSMRLATPLATRPSLDSMPQTCPIRSWKD